jgi:hypothetical protein
MPFDPMLYYKRPETLEEDIEQRKSIKLVLDVSAVALGAGALLSQPKTEEGKAIKGMAEVATVVYGAMSLLHEWQLRKLERRKITA